MTEDFSNDKKNRLEKLEKIKAAGINPYTNKYEKTHSLLTAKNSGNGTKVAVAGRLMTLRDMGKLTFAHLQDESGKMQIVFKEDNLGKDNYKFLLKHFDLGDFIGVKGEVFTTQKGEISILVSEYILLSKSLLPLPEKWHGSKDEEDRYRERYLDILTNEETRDLFIKKSKFWLAVRDFLITKGFMEVQTPILENTTGGADATPFITHHNALGIDVYLRISAGELWQKRLMVAGYEKTFEIGRVFRNEGIDPEHLQDYNQMEFYWAYANYEDGMALVEEMYKYVAEKTFGTLKFRIKNFDVDLSKKWEQYDYHEQILKFTGIDIETADLKTIKTKLDELGVKYEKTLNLGRGMDYLWKFCRKQIGGPGFLINVPVEVSPLAKRSSVNPKVTERFQPIIAGSELGNGYSELNDPIDQAERFAEQAKMREGGDTEAQMFDHDFVTALEHGMPPTCGFGFSERLFSFLADKSIRECTIFPLLKPKNN